MRQLLFIAFLFIHLVTDAQQFTVTADKMNVLYVGISNPITPMAENIPCKTLIVETSNGTVSNTSEPCQFIITPAKPGKTQI